MNDMLNWKDWHIPFSRDQITLREARAGFSALGARQDDIPLMIQLVENPRYHIPGFDFFGDEEIRIFKDATKLGFISNCRPQDKIDYAKFLDCKLGDIRQDIGLESDLILAYYRIEQRRYTDSKASQRLLA